MFVELLSVANNNRIIWGLTMLLMNLGARYISADLGKSHEKILKSQVVKKLIVFSLFFVATRDILTSFIMAILYIIVVDGILHEDSKFCIVPKGVVNENLAKTDMTLKTYKENIVRLTQFPNRNHELYRVLL